MYLKRNLVVLPVLVVLISWCVVQTNAGLVIKGNNHHGAVELLLATGILAKLLNIRAKHGGIGGQRILHALLGGYRYPAGREPLYARRPRFHPNQLLQEEMLDHHSSMAMPITDAELMLNEESALLGKAQMYQMALARPLPLVGNGHILAASEAQLMAAELDAQELLAARRARKLLATQQARKIIAEEEARKLLAQEHLLATHQARFLSPSTKIISSTQGPSSQVQTRESALEEEIGSILATREAQQLYSQQTPNMISSPSIISSSIPQQHGSGPILLQRQDMSLYPERVIMKVHVL